MGKVLAIIVSFFIAIDIAVATVPPQRPAWLVEKLKEFRLPKPKVSHVGNRSYYVETGKLRSWTRIGIKVTPGEPEQMAREFFTQYAELFGMKHDLSDLRLKRVRETRVREINDGYRVDFYQVYQEIPVYGSDIGVILKKDGEVVSAFSEYRMKIELDTLTPAISETEALQVAFGFLQVQGGVYYGPETELMIFPYKKPAKLVWVVTFSPEYPAGSWKVFVSAKTGEVVHLMDTRVYESGWGYVFDPDPVTSANTHYGAPGFEDNNDQNSTELNNQRVEKELLDITFRTSDSVYILEGPHVRITDFAYPNDPEYASPDGNFYYTRADDTFEAVMAYYHVDNFARYLNSLGYSRSRIDVDPHVDDSPYIDSYYDPVNDRIALGIEYVDGGEDSEVIIHEYTHAMEEALMGGFNYNYDESGALSEGYSDYMAGSYGYSINSFNPDTTVKWGHRPVFQGRPLNSTKHYPEDMVGEPHADGEIWSACLWEVFNQYGRDITDQLAMWSIASLWSSANFADAAKAVLDADYWLFSGVHMNYIRQVFYDRGILHPPTVTVYFPNGGETFVQGSTERIEWGINDIDELVDHIDVYCWNGSVWEHIGWDLDPSQTYYYWHITTAPTENAKIKVVLCDRADNELASDVSDEVFRIVPPPSLTLTYPNGGEIFIAGTIEKITWTYSDPDNVIDHMSLHYSTDDGQHWNDIALNVPNTGSYQWTVPHIVTDRARILVSAKNSRDVVVKQDTSDSPFIITVPPQITLIWPNEPGVVLEPGKTRQIQYHVEAEAGLKKVKAWLSLDGGTTFLDTVQASKNYWPYPTDTTDYMDWTVPEVPPTLHGRIKTVAYDQYNITGEDMSDYNFTIRLATPANFSASINSTLNNVTLTWQDRSNYEEGYIIEKKTASGWQLKDTVHDTTYSEYVRRYRDHWYRLYGYDEPTGIHSDSIYSWTTSSPILNTTQYDTTQYGHVHGVTGRNLIKRGDTLFTVYSQREYHPHGYFYRTYCRYSTNGGFTWSAPETIFVAKDQHPSWEESVIWSGDGNLPWVAIASAVRTASLCWLSIARRVNGTWQGSWATFVVNGDSIFSLVAQYYGRDMDSSIVGFVVHTQGRYIAYVLTFCGSNKVDTFTYEWDYPLRLTLGKYSGHPVLIIEKEGLAPHPCARSRYDYVWDTQSNQYEWKCIISGWLSDTLPHGRDSYLFGNLLFYVYDGEIKYVALTDTSYTAPVTLYTGNDPRDPVYTRSGITKVLMWHEYGELYYKWKALSGWSDPIQVTLSPHTDMAPSLIIRSETSTAQVTGTVRFLAPPTSVSYYVDFIYTSGSASHSDVIYKERYLWTSNPWSGGASQGELSSTMLYGGITIYCNR